MAGLPKGQREQALLLVMLVAGALVFAYWYLAYSPKSAELAAKQAHVDSLVAVNQRAKIEMAKGNVSEIRRQLAEYQQNLVLIRTLIPGQNEVPSLLEQVSTAARRVGLDVASVDPQPVVEGENYDTYRYGMSVIGGYHELAQFFSNVGSLTRIMLPVNITLQQPSNPNVSKTHAKDKSAVIEARFQLQTFVVHTTPADEQGPSKRGGA